MRETIVSELTSRGWNSGADQVEKYNAKLLKTNDISTQSTSVFGRLTTGISGIMAGMGGLVTTLSTVYSGFQKVLTIVADYNETEDAAAIIARKFGISVAEAINSITEATRGQASNMANLVGASNIIMESIQLSRSDYLEFLDLITSRSQEMGISVEENLNRVAQAVASGQFRNSLLQAGFVTDGLKEKFKEAGTDAERFDLLLQDLRDTVGGGPASLSDQIKELGVEMDHLIAQSFLQVIDSVTSTTGNVESLTEALRNTRGEVERNVTQLTSFIRQLQELNESPVFAFFAGGGLTGLFARGISGLFGSNRQSGYETIQTGLAEEAAQLEQIRRLEESGNRALNLLSAPSVLRGAQGTATRKQTGGNQQENEMMVFTEEDIQESLNAEKAATIEAMADWTNKKQQLQDQANELFRIKEQEHLDYLLLQRRKSNDEEQALLESQQQQLQLASQQNQEILSKNGLAIDDINLAFGDAMTNQIQSGAMKISDTLLATSNNIRIFSSTASSALGQFAQGFTQALTSWAKGEKSFKAAMRDMAATVLTSLGEQALVQAIMETGLGIASIARYDYGAAALHFAAAATFGIISGMTLPAGIALSANSAKSTQSTTTQSRERTSSVSQSYGGTTQSNGQTVVVNNYWNGNPLLTQRDIEETIYSGWKKAAIRHAT